MSNLDDKAKEHGHERLADFIRHNQATIIDEWVGFAGTRSPASDGMSRLALKDHIVDILSFVAADLETAQTLSEQVDKSHGMNDGAGPFRHTAAEVHAALRHADGFDIDQNGFRISRIARKCCQAMGSGPQNPCQHRCS